MLKKFFMGLVLILMSILANADINQPLPIDQAFNFSAQVKDKDTVVAKWKIAPGYYLYKDRFSYKIVEPEQAELGPIIMPEGIPQHDNILGDYDIYKNELSIEVPLEDIEGNSVTVKVCYQGCSSDHFCYPPETKEVTLDLTKTNGSSVQGITVPAASADLAEHDAITRLLFDSGLPMILLSFLGFGLLLSFTPCVLPMIPILSGIIIGHGDNITTRKAFMLSLVYVLAMAVTYAIAGVLAGFAGSGIQAAFQIPWVIALFSLIFVLLALSLFGLYELRLPASWQQKITDASNHQKGGTYLGVAIMGVLSTLIVSPCVTAPLVGALAYIGKTGDAVLGGSALFAMGIGMGLPLLAIGTSHGKILPKAGNWMSAVQAFFGVMLLAVAIWMISRVIPGQISMLLWAALLIISAVYMGVMKPIHEPGWRQFFKGCGLVAAIYGIILMVGASMGNTNPLKPLDSPNNNYYPIGGTFAKPVEDLFIHIKTNDDFDRELAAARKKGRPVMLDFYADWCIACKEMEINTFAKPEVQAALKDFVLLQADVTANDVMDKALEERLGVIAPPTILFFDSNSDELIAKRIVGEMGPDKFIEHVKGID